MRAHRWNRDAHGKRTFDQSVDFFEKEGYQPHEGALKETKRGTSDPTYLYYTLGKLQILKLREDYRKMKGSQFSLQEFHDNFLKQGFPPIKDRAARHVGERLADAMMWRTRWCVPRRHSGRRWREQCGF